MAEIIRRSSQGMRLLQCWNTLVFRYGLSVGVMAAIFSMSSVVSSRSTSMASSKGDYSHKPLLVIGHRHGEEIISAHLLRDLLAVGIGAHRYHVPLHQRAPIVSPVPASSSVRTVTMPVSFFVRRGDVAVVNRLLVHSHLPYMRERLFHRHAFAQAHIFGGHYAPRAVRRVFEKLVHRGAGPGGPRRQGCALPRLRASPPRYPQHRRQKARLLSCADIPVKMCV